MLDPDSTSRSAPTHVGAPARLDGPHTLQILMTEHWSLLASRSLVYTEAMARASVFIAALSGAIVALALVAQATDFGTGFVSFALVLLPVVFFLGVSTVVRLAQLNCEDATWVQGMNRIRNAYLDLAPELEPYFVTSRHDDDAGILHTTLALRGPVSPAQAFVAIPGVVAVIDAVVAGATAGIAAQGLGSGLVTSLALGAVTSVAVLALFAVWAERTIDRFRRQLEIRFPGPSPAAADA